MQSVQVKVDYPDKLSRGVLLLKTFFGWLILIPHFVALWVLAVVAGFVAFIAFFAVLFTGKYPKGLFDLMVGFMGWTWRVSAYAGLMRDEYPAFGFKADYPASFSVTYPDKLSRGLLLLRLFFSYFYVLIPHGFCLAFRIIGFYFVMLVAWFAILFTGKMPQSMFSYISGTFRWSMNISAYLYFLTDEYPPFTGKDGGGAAAAKPGVAV